MNKEIIQELVREYKNRKQIEFEDLEDIIARTLVERDFTPWRIYSNYASEKPLLNFDKPRTLDGRNPFSNDGIILGRLFSLNGANEDVICQLTKDGFAIETGYEYVVDYSQKHWWKR